MSEQRDFYSILQVNRKATADDIERAYERLSRLYDPEQSKKRRAAERWALIKEAYETLSDDSARAAYDRSMGSGLSVPVLGRESAVTSFLSSRYGLPTIAGLVVAIVVVAVLVSVFSGDDDSSAVGAISTPSASVDDTPIPIAPATPPPVVGDEVTTESGLTYIEITAGTGASPVLDDTVVVHYTGWLESDGTKFDSSVDREQPFDFVLGRGEVIAGWDEGLALMSEGGTTRLIIPSDLAYRDTGQGTIPPGATLIFDIELIEVKPTATPDPASTDTGTGTNTPAPSGTTTPNPDSEATE
ncbi:MAG: FKBP-type peptidyl-prolyl cis-trans isomerase [Chloroflexi bacterium]|nr:FKBP-type peptidyl-prolyl cis-trans isomerase [Chloroflexota bacterium]